LLALADFVTKVHAICMHCGDLAHHSFRTATGDELVVLGEKDRYIPLCRSCFHRAMAERERPLNEGG
jgi:thymidine kinase